jgi:hypothetical protein
LPVPSDAGVAMGGGASPGTWRWVSRLPQGNALAAVWGSAPDDAWAVGAHGALLHLDATSAQVGPSPAENPDLTAVWGSAHDDVWVAGEAGTLLHFDGAAWTVTSSGTTRTLNALWGSGPRDVYAAGDAGTLLHFDGSAWSPLVSGTDKHLHAVAGTGATDVWVGGGTPCVECTPVGVLLHGGAGSGFTVVAKPPPVSGLWAHGANDLWLGTQTGLRHFDGSALTTPAGAPALSAFAAAPSGAWGLFNNGYYRFSDGGTWIADPATASDWLYAVWSANDGTAWAVGDHGLLAHWDGAAWTEPYPPSLPGQSLFAAIWGAAGDDIYVGNAELPDASMLYHFDGASFQAVQLPPAGSDFRVVSIAGSGASDVWLAGIDYSHQPNTVSIDHFDGAAWTPVTPPAALADVAGVFSTGPGEIWIAATEAPSYAAVLLHGRTSGGATTWQVAALSSDQSAHVTAIWASGPGDIYVAAVENPSTPLRGVVFHGDGTRFTAEDTPDTLPWLLWGSGPGDVWAAGDWNQGPATLAHRGPSGWQAVAVPPGIQHGPMQPVSALWGTSSDNVYMAVRGTIARWDGAAFHLDADLTYNPIGAIGGAGGVIFAVGEGGTLLRRE